MKKMKAVICPRYGPPEVLQFTEVERPEPQAGEIRVRIHATTVTVADFRVRSFTIPRAIRIPGRFMIGFRGPKWPILGAELSGVVDALGPGVTQFREGDEVFAASLKGFGAYAEYICLKAEGAIAHKPAHVSHEAAAAIPIGGRTALHFLRKGGLKAGQNVLVYGASGSVGTYAVQLAKHFGAEVTGICSGRNADLVRSLGADHVIDYTDGDFTRHLEQYDLQFMAVNAWPFAQANRFLKPGGSYVHVAALFKSPRMLWASWTKRKKIVMSHDPPESADDLALLARLVAEGQIEPVIDRSYPWEEIVEAHRYVDTRRKRGNVVLRIR